MATDWERRKRLVVKVEWTRPRWVKVLGLLVGRVGQRDVGKGVGEDLSR